MLRLCGYDVLHLGCLLLVELRHHVIEFGLLACGGSYLELRLSLGETDGWSVGPEGWQACSHSVLFWAVHLLGYFHRVL